MRTKPSVIKYKNYGFTDSSIPDNNIYDHNFYWSFYELNNGKIIHLEFVENLTNGMVTSVDYFFGYPKSELKSGEIIEYKFGNAEPNTQEMSKEFFDWFNANPPVKDCKDLIWPTKDEEKCVKDFFNKNILKNKEVQTNIINL